MVEILRKYIFWIVAVAIYLFIGLSYVAFVPKARKAAESTGQKIKGQGSFLDDPAYKDPKNQKWIDCEKQRNEDMKSKNEIAMEQIRERSRFIDTNFLKSEMATRIFTNLDPKNPPDLPTKLKLIAAHDRYRDVVLRMFNPLLRGEAPEADAQNIVGYYMAPLDNIYTFSRSKIYATQKLLLVTKDLNILYSWARVLVKDGKPRYIKYLNSLKCDPFAVATASTLGGGGDSGFGGGFTPGGMPGMEPGGMDGATGMEPGGMTPGMEPGGMPGMEPGGMPGGMEGGGGGISGINVGGPTTLGAGAKDIVTLPKPNKGKYREIKFHMEVVCDLRDLDAFVALLLNNEFLYLNINYVRWTAIIPPKHGKVMHDQLVAASIEGNLLHYEFKYEDYFEKKDGKNKK